MAEILWAAKNSFLQASLSAFISVFLGVWCAFGLISFSSEKLMKWRKSFEIFCLLPNFLPPIFTLLSVLNLIDPFPMGISGIVIVHAIMNFGLVAVIIAEVIESKAGSVIELALIEGSSKFQFLSKGLLPMISRDIFSVGLFVFVICFQSFSVPLIVGGGRGTTMEVLIYEKIRLSSDWSAAVILASLQSFFVFLLSLLIRKKSFENTKKNSNLKLIESHSGVLIILVFFISYVIGYGDGVVQGFKSISTLYGLQFAIFWNFLGSMCVGLSVGFLTFIILMLIAFCWPKIWFEKFLAGYLAPSISLSAFSFLIFGANNLIACLIKIMLVLTLIFLTSLFRIGWQSDLGSLNRQINIASLMGASPWQIFMEITVPQLTDRAGKLAGIGSVWACGDFAASRILATQDFSIALMIETLISGYRLSQATLISLLIIISGILCYFICTRGSHVLCRKFNPYSG